VWRFRSPPEDLITARGYRAVPGSNPGGGIFQNK
jgi:hypothetical protein